MSRFVLRAMQREDWPAVAGIIYASTNAWYQQHARPAIFTCPIDDVQLFCKVYEDLDPGCCIIAEDAEKGRIAGSCFYHPRKTHVSLGIMNVHPDYFGHGIARRLLTHITDLADQRGLPARLVSSAVNLDSFSLYNRAGFVPRVVYQDLIMTVPPEGLPAEAAGPLRDRVRPATPADVPAMAALEREVSGIEREKDLRYFVENRDGIWGVSVLDPRNPRNDGEVEGFLVSVTHPASTMLGPGVMRTPDQAAALIHAELTRLRCKTPVWLIPADQHDLVQTMYRWGARNCELHLHQCRGQWHASRGITMPTFMPETA